MAEPKTPQNANRHTRATVLFFFPEGQFLGSRGSLGSNATTSSSSSGIAFHSWGGAAWPLSADIVRKGGGIEREEKHA